MADRQPTPEDQKAADLFLKTVNEQLHLSPGLGMGTPAWDPNEGLARYHRRREAQGLSADERMQTLLDAGVTDREGMQKVAQRLYASPEKAFMLARGGK
jgi:hypothetical protein